MFKKLFAAAGLALALAACQPTSGPVYSGGGYSTGYQSTISYNRDFTVYNRGRNAVYYIYVSPVTTNSWEEDVLGRDVLMPGSSVTVRMPDYGSQCYFDIRIVDSTGYAQEFYNVDLCTVSSVSFP